MFEFRYLLSTYPRYPVPGRTALRNCVLIELKAKIAAHLESPNKTRALLLVRTLSVINVYNNLATTKKKITWLKYSVSSPYLNNLQYTTHNLAIKLKIRTTKKRL